MKSKLISVFKVLWSISIVVLCINCAENVTYSEAFLDKIDNDYLNERKPEYGYSNNFLKGNQVVEFIEDSKDPKSKRYAQSLQQVCNYTKIPFKRTDIINWNKELFTIHPSVRVICVNKTNKLNNHAITSLLKFVANGGTLVIPNYKEDKRMGYLYGLTPEADFSVDERAYGYYFSTNILPNHKGKNHKKRLVHNGLTKTNFKDDIEILATAINDEKYPVIIKNQIGKGKVVFFNSDTYFERNDRGLFFSNILMGLEGIAYPIANCSTIFLDDFPATLYESKEEPIASEFNLSTARFVDQVWWPDMKKIAKKYNIKYTTTITFNYNQKVKPPFLYTEWDNLKKNVETGSLSNWITNDVIDKNHELALHGYNHVSLTKKDWTVENINLSLNTVKKKWGLSNYGQLPVTYIPPTNIIDKFGLEALTGSMPSIKYMCSAYSGSIKNGSGREFNPDPYNNRIFDYPRVCSGFYMSDKKYFNQQSVYLFTGIWTHFVHPDDVLQIPNKHSEDKGFEKRNNLSLGWYYDEKGRKGMYYRFNDLLSKHQKTYPLSKFYKANKGAALASKWRAASYEHSIKNDFYSVSNLDDDYVNNNHWFVYVSEENISVIKKYLNSKQLSYGTTELLIGELFQIKTDKPSIALPILFNKPLKDESETELLAYNDFNKSRIIFQTNIIAENKLKVETLESKIRRLKKELFKPKTIDTTKWNEYAKLKAWEEKPLEVWDDLELYYNQNKHQSIPAYSKTLASKIWYPNDQIKHQWLTRNIEVNTDNLAYHKEYVSNYNTEDNSSKVVASLEEIATREPTIYNIEMYIKHLLWNKSDFNLSQLDKIEPSEEYSEVAEEVAWFYYNKNNFVKAIAWSDYAKDMDVAVKLDWMFKTKQIDRLKKAYNNHIKNSPNDDEAKIAMAYIYHGLGEFKNAYLTTVSISEDYEGKNKLVSMLSNDVKYIDVSLQKELLKNNDELFDKKLKDSLLSEIRIKNNNSISFSGDIGSDRLNTSFFEKKTSYIIKGEKHFDHQISVINSTLYQLKNTVTEDDNIDRDVFGVQYQLSTPEKFEKVNYWANARVEKDIEDDEYFYKGQLGAKLAKENSFISTQLQTFPVRNGPGYSKKIYRNIISVYFEQRLLKKRGRLSAFTEGNYYTDEVFSNANTIKFQYDAYKLSKITFKPFVEGQLSFASIDRVNSYPYWVVNNRYFGGSGLGLVYGNQYKSKTFLTVDGAYFLDDYTGAFTRFTGNTSIRFLKHFVFKGSFEYYVQSEYYSNRFQFGLKYFMK